MCGADEGESCRYEFVSAGAPGMSAARWEEHITRVYNPDTPPWIALPAIAWVFTTMQRAMLEGPLLASLKARPLPELIVCEATTLGGSDVAELLGVPYALLGSMLSTTMQGASHRVASLDGPSWIPLVSIPYHQPRSAIASVPSRLARTFGRAANHAIIKLVFERARNDVRADFGLPPASGFFANDPPPRYDAPPTLPPPLVIIAESPGITPARPMPPNWQLVGPLIDGIDAAGGSSIARTPLGQWLDATADADGGHASVLYVSYGSVVRLTDAEVRTLGAALIEVVKGAKEGWSDASEQRRVRVLWSLPAPQQFALAPLLERARLGDPTFGERLRVE
ncbi:hypothetical protein T484DRAFT_1848949, partial [Baffinella frigidus]